MEENIEARLALWYWPFAVKGDKDACWNWTGKTDKYGYGRLATIVGGEQLAHRWSYRLAKGAKPPRGAILRHTCGNKICLNPAHMKLSNFKTQYHDRKAAGLSTPLPCYRGEAHGGAKLTAAQVAEIRGRYFEAVNRGEKFDRVVVAQEFGVHRATIGDIVLYKVWKDVAPAY